MHPARPKFWLGVMHKMVTCLLIRFNSYSEWGLGKCMSTQTSQIHNSNEQFLGYMFLCVTFASDLHRKLTVLNMIYVKHCLTKWNMLRLSDVKVMQWKNEQEVCAWTLFYFWVVWGPEFSYMKISPWISNVRLLSVSSCKWNTDCS